MNLLGIRQKFIELSGREDLASTTDQSWDTDAGADFFIQAGTRYLDFMTEHDRQEAVYEATLAADECEVELKNCRVVKAVWIEGDDGWEALEHKSEADLREDYPDWTETTSDTPLYWAQFVGRRVPSQAGSGIPIEKKGVIVLPPTETAVTVRIVGLFHSYPLEENDEENFWSVNYPDALVWAAMRSLEASYRNTEGMKDWERALEPLLRGVSDDNAAFIGDEPSQMEG